MKFHLINDDVPSESRDTIASACEKEGVEFVEHVTAGFTFMPEIKAQPGDLLFRPAISYKSQLIEQHLYTHGVATFYKLDDGIFRSGCNYLQLFEYHNIPIPRSFRLLDTNRNSLNYYVEQLGGFPVILKALGGSSGIGVMRLSDKSSLYSVADFVMHNGTIPVISSYIENAIHYRCVVVGDKVIAAYLNPIEEGDFRSYGSDNKSDIFSQVEDDISTVAVAAVKALELEFGGVDIMVHDSGRCFVLEANFPCYFAHAQIHGGIDVAGHMVRYLIRKSEILMSESHR